MNSTVKTIAIRVVPLVGVYAIVLGLINAGIINDYLQATLATICINIVLAASLNLITGFTGQFSLGHAGFQAVGAYVCAMITMANPTMGGFIVGLVAGSPTARPACPAFRVSWTGPGCSC